MRAAPHIQAELVVVDNASHDGTFEALERWAANQTIRLSIHRAPDIGLSHARNCGLAKTQNSVIAMTDDDCRVREDYIARIAEAFQADNQPVVRGGRVELGDARDLPITIKVQDEAATYVPGKKLSGFIHGANLMFSRQIYDDLGEFDVRFGAGARFKSAEDTDYMLRAAIRGYPIKYDPTISVVHFHGRRSNEVARELVAQYHFGDGALYAKHLFRSLLPLKMLKGAVVNTIRERRGVFPPGQFVPRPFAFALGHNCRGMIDYLFRRG
jgi:GT2 family glycosyltransferase